MCAGKRQAPTPSASHYTDRRAVTAPRSTDPGRATRDANYSPQNLLLTFSGLVLSFFSLGGNESQQREHDWLYVVSVAI